MSWYRTPEELLAELGITRPEHIDMEAIAFHLNAIVRYRNLDGCAARIVGAGDKAIISIDPRCGEGRKRFSIGHELGHWMKDRGRGMQLCDKSMISESSESSGGSNNPEVAANRYSSDLILPPSMLRPRLKGRPVTFNTIKEVANEFQTSLTATVIKSVGLTDLPCVLISFNKQGERRFSRSSGVPSNLWPHQELHYETPAFTVLYGDKTEAGPQPVKSSLWFNHRDASKYLVMEHSIKLTGDSVYSLLWWKDKSQLDGLR